MGIRLQCPQGHKVNVKSSLAGKRGICPQCGAKFDIPTATNVAPDGGGDEIDVVADLGDRPNDTAQRALASISENATKPARIGPFETPEEREAAAEPAALDLDALAAAGGTSLLGGHAFGPASQRLADRRKTAYKMRMFTLALTVGVTLLACVLLYIVFRSR